MPRRRRAAPPPTGSSKHGRRGGGRAAAGWPGPRRRRTGRRTRRRPAAPACRRSRSSEARRGATSPSSASPVSCPSESLMTLKWSRSRKMAPTCPPVRAARESACSSRSRSSARFGSPVSGSCSAWWRMRRSLSRRSCRLARMSAIAWTKTTSSPLRRRPRAWMRISPASPSRDWIGSPCCRPARSLRRPARPARRPG